MFEPLLISITFLFILPLLLLASLSNALDKPNLGPMLVVGASGGTGFRALNGLLDVGYDTNQIRVLTRNLNKPSSVKLRELGFETVSADLDDPESLHCPVKGCIGCYIHSTSGDTKKLDTKEVERARNLAVAIAATGDIRHVVFNSAAGEPGHGVKRIAQKQDVERVFLEEFPGIPFTSLRANLFMEELWKGYTRPAALKGSFPFSVPSDRNVYLTSVRDMGRLAGMCLMSPLTTAGRKINVAGDMLTPAGIAASFARSQGTPCVHQNSAMIVLLSRLFFRYLYEIIRFYRRSTEATDIGNLKTEFPGLLTSFEKFLEETRWSDRSLSFEDLTVIQQSSVQ